MSASRGAVRVLIAGGAILAALAVSPPVDAHKKHGGGAGGRPADATGDSGRRGAATTASSSGEGRAAPADRYNMPPLSEALLEHLHNKVVHFPIALAPAGLLLMVAGRRRAGLAEAGMLLSWLAALAGGIAFLAGRAQEGAFHGEPKEWLVGTHEAWGIAAVVALWLWALLALRRSARRHLWVVGVIATGLVLTTAFFGGLVAHGE